jgi:hypothetical protein
MGVYNDAEKGMQALRRREAGKDDKKDCRCPIGEPRMFTPSTVK